MDISSYLISLTKTHKEVGIAGFGTIFKKKVPGRYDSESHSFVPPGYILSFKAETVETSLLRDYVCKKKNISGESADYFISNYSEDLITQIKEKNEADLGGLGLLIKQGDEWIIQQSGHNSPDFGFYGLPPINESLNEEIPETLPEDELAESSDQVFSNELLQDEPISETKREEPLLFRDDETNAGISENDEQETFEEVSEIQPSDYSSDVQVEPLVSERSVEEQPSVPDEPILSDEKPIEAVESGAANIWHFDRTNTPSTSIKNTDHQEDDKKMALWLKILIGLIILAVVVVALYFVKPSIFEPIMRTQGVKPTVKTQPVKRPVLIDTLSKADTAKIAITALPIDTLTDTLTIDSAVTWEIIGASLTKKEVPKYISDMKAKGYTAKAIPAMPGKRTKMSIATFSDEKSAREGRSVLVKKLKNHDLYIYQNKHTQKPI